METLDDHAREDQVKLTEKALHDLKSTRSWLITAAVVYMALAVITVFAGFIGTGSGNSFGLFNLIAGGISIAVNTLLLTQARAIKEMTDKKSTEEVEKFAAAYKSYWSVQGVLAVIGALIIVCVIILVLTDAKAFNSLF